MSKERFSLYQTSEIWGIQDNQLEDKNRIACYVGAELIIEKMNGLQSELDTANKKIEDLSDKEYLAYKKIAPQIKGCLDREKEKDQRIAELEKEVEKLKEENEFLEENNRIIRGLCHNYYEQLNNYKTEKYDLGIRVEELRKIKFNSFIEKKRYYKGFENCERQCASHIVDLKDEIKVLEKALELACDKLDEIYAEYFNHAKFRASYDYKYFIQQAEKELLGDKE